MESLFETYGDKYFNGLDMSKLDIDQAYLIIDNIPNREAYLYGAYNDCINCPLVDQYDALYGNTTRIISTRWQKNYKVLTSQIDMLPPDTTENVLCDIDTIFGEFGVYHLKIEETSCKVDTLKEPVNIYLPILTVLCIYFCFFGVIALLVFLTKMIKKRYKNDEKCKEVNDIMAPKRERVQSLDTFRGITIALMIFVNYGGGEYNFIDHAIWNGLHIADLVFPWFLWIMGVCIPISVRSTIKRGETTTTALLGITRRSTILFAIGLFLGGGSNLNKIRIFGVLQRFGICYFVVASLCFIMTKNYERSHQTTTKYGKMFLDVLKIKFSWIVMIVILILYLLVLFLVPFENCPRGYLGPGGLHELRKYENCTGGITGYIDKVILGNHRYKGALIKTIYQSQVLDPEGIPGCLPSIIQVFFGVQAGITLLTFKNHKERLLRWLAWAVFFGILGGALCGFSRDDGIIPINKHLWSISFVFVTTSLAFVLLGICYILVDVQKLWSGKPFLYAGMNAIIMYIGHSMVYSNFPFRWCLDDYNTHFFNFLENIWATTMWLVVAYILYRKKFFLSI